MDSEVKDLREKAINQAQLLEEGVAKYLNLDLVSLTHPNPVLNQILGLDIVERQV